MNKQLEQRRTFLPYIVLLIGVLAVASASIMIRFLQQQQVPSLAIAAGRMGIAALVLLPIVLLRGLPAVRLLTRRQVLLGIASGVLLAAHFASWITSLGYTSVASSVALVATNPLWVGLASLLIFRDRLSRPLLAGIGLTFGGTVLIAVSDASGGGGPNAMLGNALALLGAATVSGYLLLGRELRALPTLVYIWLVYTAAAVVLLVFALGSGALAGINSWKWSAWGLLLGLALVPQLIGHTSFNWALRHVSATFIAVTILGEPVGAALIAWAVFNERFAPLQLGGFVLLLAGILVAARAERRAARDLLTSVEEPQQAGGRYGRENVQKG